MQHKLYTNKLHVSGTGLTMLPAFCETLSIVDLISSFSFMNWAFSFCSLTNSMFTANKHKEEHHTSFQAFTGTLTGCSPLFWLFKHLFHDNQFLEFVIFLKIITVFIKGVWSTSLIWSSFLCRASSSLLTVDLKLLALDLLSYRIHVHNYNRQSWEKASNYSTKIIKVHRIMRRWSTSVEQYWDTAK